MSKREIIRRLRFGNVRRLLRARCGHTLPDDDAGREYLWDLLLPVSLGAERDRKMENIIAVSAPWIKPKEASEMSDQIKRLPRAAGMPTSRALGIRLRLTREEWICLKLKTILPYDMTGQEIAEFRKAKRRASDIRRRRAKGRKPRADYLANSLSKKKPWDKDGMSRRQWERRRAKANVASVPQEHKCRVASVPHIKLT